MCSCRKNKNGCSTKVKKLEGYKKKITTLINTSQDSVKNAEYSGVFSEILTHINRSSEVCPSNETVSAINQYINNEYSKRN